MKKVGKMKKGLNKWIGKKISWNRKHRIMLGDKKN